VGDGAVKFAHARNLPNTGVRRKSFPADRQIFSMTQSAPEDIDVPTCITGKSNSRWLSLRPFENRFNFVEYVAVGFCIASHFAGV
jgi:hypothetical protein